MLFPAQLAERLIKHNQQDQQSTQQVPVPASQQVTFPEEWLSLKEISHRANLHVQTIRRYIREGLIPYNQPRKGCAIRIEWTAFQKAFTNVHPQ